MSAADLLADLPDAHMRAAVILLREALILRMYGERPPGAPRDNPHAETWRDWDQRTEHLLRHLDGDRS